ncbi:hypothetical protein [Histidinibacterium lentulum]|uniref:hypothetical protein n=1 Tax=Histidinibacterium lentulum TaxID=2480588 RepID=UPI00160AFF84|nr:hypothetical protein [Histidinibacterium lentulum]
MFAVLPDRGWKKMKQETVVMTVPIASDVQTNEDVKVYVAFDKTPPLDGENVLHFLRAFSRKLHEAIEVLEAEVS